MTLVSHGSRSYQESRSKKESSELQLGLFSNMPRDPALCIGDMLSCRVTVSPSSFSGGNKEFMGMSSKLGMLSSENVLSRIGNKGTDHKFVFASALFTEPFRSSDSQLGESKIVV